MTPVIDAARLAQTVDWLADGCPPASAGEVTFALLCERLGECGVPLAHGGLYIRTLHPEVMGRRVTWTPQQGVETSTVGYDLFQDPEIRAGPIKFVFDTGEGLRRLLADPDCPMDFTFLDKFRAEGLTDFLAVPLRFSDGAVHVVAWMTREAGGFPAAALQALRAIEKPVARMIEVRTLQRLAVNLLDVYVGGQAGTRILGGSIRRGDVESIRAAIWLSDMRGFTSRADRMPAPRLVELLNRYFDCQVPAIRAHGGDVLKFMGDGLLAIFPIGEAVAGNPDMATVCSQALAAARSVQAAVSNADWGGLEAPGELHFGVALHVGEVLYGNVGSSNRLDFTCIGPAVNVAARIEKLSGEIDRTILASRDFALECPAEVASGALAPLGEFTLKGVAARQLVYGLA